MTISTGQKIIGVFITIICLGIIIALVIIQPWNDDDSSQIITTNSPINDQTTINPSPQPHGPSDFCSEHHKNFLKILSDPKDSPYIDYQEIKNEKWPHYFEDYQVTGHYLNVTSLYYLTDKESTASIWRHRVFVYVPDKFDDEISHVAHFFNRGGENRNSDGEFLTEEQMNMSPSVNRHVRLASFTGTVTIYMYDNPNQPMYYLEEKARNLKRTEDAVIAYSWRHFIDNPTDYQWILQIPMNKAIINTFNAVQHFTENSIYGITLQNYVISGDSKRGWTSWLTAALDQRVIGSLPKVFDLVRTRETLHGHYRALGGWSFAFNPYYNENLTNHLDDQIFEELQCFIDPDDWTYQYQNRNLPIYHTGATGDEFFLVTDINVWLEDYLRTHTNPTPNFWMRYLHNAEHSQIGHELFQYSSDISLRIFYLAMAKNNWQNIIPKVTWENSQNQTHGKIILKTDALERNSDINLSLSVYATDTNFPTTDRNGVLQDFRLAHLSRAGIITPSIILWNRTEIVSQVAIEEIDYKKEWVITMEKRTENKGFRAFYVDLDFDMSDFGGKFLDGREASILTISSLPNIMPREYGIDDCSQAECYGNLV